VVVPVGEPGSSDPYDSQGDLGCGSDSGAVNAMSVSGPGDRTVVLVVFVGTENLWVFSMNLLEYGTILADLQDLWDTYDLDAISREDIDTLHDDLCAPASERSDEGRRLYGIFQDVLKERMEEMTLEACE